ncbi:MAG: MFS transporter [candidate division Zixibacteria bacterium]
MADSVWRKDIIGWSLYDFANTIFSMNIVSNYFKRYIVEDLGHSDAYFDIPLSISMLMAAVLLPLLGAMSDQGRSKKLFLFFLTLTCCLATGLIAYVPPAALILTLVLFVLASFFYEACMPFYNALLYSIADGNRARFISGLGVAIGYVGAIVGVLIVLPFVEGNLFGYALSLGPSGKLAAFVPTALLFMGSALPLFFWVQEKPVKKVTKGGIAVAYRDVWDGIRQTRKYPGVLRFLVADYFFEDAIATVIINIGLYCSLIVGMTEREISQFLIISTVSAVIGSYLFGLVAQNRSLKKLLNMIVIGWIFALVAVVFAKSAIVIWILGSVIGVLLGGVWTVSRPLLAEMVPREELGKFFGLFSLSGRAAAALGPLVWTAVVYFLKQRVGETSAIPYQGAILSLALMMLIGLIIFRKVPDTHRSEHD